MTVTVSTGCPWSATSSVSWLTITSGGSGSGNGQVRFTVAACGASGTPSSCPRTGTLTVAQQQATVRQEAPVLEFRGNYTFEIQVPAWARQYSGCNWPVPVHRWPVTVRMIEQGLARITFPAPPPGVQLTREVDLLFSSFSGRGLTEIRDYVGLLSANSYSVGTSSWALALHPTQAPDGRAEVLTGEWTQCSGCGVEAGLTLHGNPQACPPLGCILNHWGPCYEASWYLRTR